MRIIITRIKNKIGDNMDYKKIFTDFEKRYGESCENAYFIGKPITFFSRQGFTVGTSVSTGGVIVLSKRDDNRVIVEFSDSDDFISCNKIEFKYHKDKEIIKYLLDAQEYGVDVGGVRILMYYNTSLDVPKLPLLFSALGDFCKNAPKACELIKHFDNFCENMLALSSRKDCVTVFDGQRVQYLKLPDSDVKIVLSNIGEKISISKIPQDSSAKDGTDALLRGDLEKFGKFLDKDTKWILENNKVRGVKKLFDAAVRLGDAYGSGILADGGIFSVVKNNRVDTFMHNLGAEYEKHFGARPDFYVTRTEDSGVSVFREE